MSRNLYDEAEFFAGYSRLPRSREGLAAAPEWPTLRSMLPPLAGSRVLDLGCGFGAFCRWAAEEGAGSILGVDRSQNMLARARAETKDARVTYRLARLEELEVPEASVDVVYSSLVFHYLDDFAQVCRTIRKLLARGGWLVFSVEHPIMTAPSHAAWLSDADRGAFWPLNGYADEGPRTTHWFTPGVVKQHRTVSTYINCLIDSGYRIARMEEWAPDCAQIAAHPEWANEIERPSFLLVSAQLASEAP